jgi:hypothetical protein
MLQQHWLPAAGHRVPCPCCDAVMADAGATAKVRRHNFRLVDCRASLPCIGRSVANMASYAICSEFDFGDS